MSRSAIALTSLALALALVGTAIAAPDAVTEKITRAKVRSIAAKQADKRITARAPELSVERASVADNASNLGARPPDDYALAEAEPYHEIGATGEPAFENGWSNLGGGRSTAAFYRDSESLVHLKGVVSGTTSTTAFTLPQGYRPSEQLFMPAAISGEYGAVNVFPDGRVLPICSPNCVALGIDGLTFRLP